MSNTRSSSAKSPTNKSRFFSSSSWVSRLPRRQLSPFWIGICVISLMFSWLTYFRTPIALDFYNYGFMDSGSNLTLHELLGRGFQPGRDFGYSLGWLTLAFNRIWFSIFGATPAAFRLFIFAFEVIAAGSLWRLLSVFMEKRPALILTLCGAPLFLSGSYPGFSYLLEIVLLIQALRLHFNNRKRDALFLTAVCVFVDPAMAYIYGLWLVISILREDQRREPAIPQRGTLVRVIHEFGPAAVAVATLFGASVTEYGLGTSLQLLRPLPDGTSYWAHLSGFMTEGRNFWAPEGAKIGYYLGTGAGIWVVGTIALLLESTSKRRSPALVLLAYLHLGLIVFLFGNPFAWAKYFYILLAAFAVLIGMIRTPTPRRRLTQLLCLVLLLAQRSTTQDVLRRWKDWSHGVDMFRLWAEPAVVNEWKEIQRLIDQKRVQSGGDPGTAPKIVVLTLAGGIEGLVKSQPQPTVVRLEPVTTFQLYPARAVPSEIDRKTAQLKTSTWVLIPKRDVDFLRLSLPNLVTWIGPGLSEVKMSPEQFPEVVFDGTYFRLVENHAPRGT